MCLFTYRQCRLCRFPDTRTISLAHECPAFQYNVLNFHFPSLTNLAAAYPHLPLVAWQQQGLSICRRLGEGWQIVPSRDCVMWSAGAEAWTCLVCEVREKVQRDERALQERVMSELESCGGGGGDQRAE
jgi:hypothetical protein